MSNKRNVVLYVDGDLIKKTRELGFNLSKTFENHMKSLIYALWNGYSGKYSVNSSIIGSPGEMRKETCSNRVRFELISY